MTYYSEASLAIWGRMTRSDNQLKTGPNISSGPSCVKPRTLDNKVLLIAAGLILVLNVVIRRVFWLGDAYQDNIYSFANSSFLSFFQKTVAAMGPAVWLLIMLYAVRAKWKRKSLTLLLIPVIASVLGFLFFVTSHLPVNQTLLPYSEQARIADGVTVELLYGPSHDVDGLESSRVVVLERPAFGGFLREYKPLIAVPHIMVPVFSIDRQKHVINYSATGEGLIVIRRVFDIDWDGSRNQRMEHFD